jgi:hypothetical protein
MVLLYSIWRPDFLIVFKVFKIEIFDDTPLQATEGISKKCLDSPQKM